MLELYQFEECPHSRQVRIRMTDLGVDYLIRNVPREKEKRDRLLEISGQMDVPTLVHPERNKIIAGNSIAIIRYIEEHYEQIPEIKVTLYRLLGFVSSPWQNPRKLGRRTPGFR